MTPQAAIGPFATAIPVSYAIGITIMLAALVAVLALLGYFIRDLKKGMIQKDQEHDKAIIQIGRDFNEFRVHCAETFVQRDDYVRSQITLEAMITDQGRFVRSIARDLNQWIGEKKASDAS